MATDYFLAFNGYGYFSEGIQPQLSRHAMISSNHVYVPNDTSIEIPFYTEDDIEIVYTKDGTQTTVDTASEYTGVAASSVKYVTFTPNTDDTPYDIKVYDNGQTTLLKTIKLIPVCEPKYTSIRCYFLNRYGVIQQMYFFKRTDEQMEIEDTTFNRNMISSTATYDNESAQKMRFDVKAKTSLQLNTGFVDEDFNTTIEELFLSEFIWVEYESNKLPAIPRSKQMQYQTALNNKLINYTVQFDLAFDTVNSVR